MRKTIRKWHFQLLNIEIDYKFKKESDRLTVCEKASMVWEKSVLLSSSMLVFNMIYISFGFFSLFP